MKRLLPRPTYGNVMATIAVFVALGGVSYAASGTGSGPATKDWNGSTYRVQKNVSQNSDSTFTKVTVSCKPGDRALGGGFAGLDSSVGTLYASYPYKVGEGQQGWFVQYTNAKPGIPVAMFAMVRCANFQ